MCLIFRHLFLLQKLYNKSYFEVGRSPRKRSLLGVNEYFKGKPNAKRALLDDFFYLFTVAPTRIPG